MVVHCKSEKVVLLVISCSWLLVIGASYHITSYVTKFSQSIPYNDLESVRLGNSAKISISNVGHGYSKTFNSNNILFHDMLYTSHIAANLNSVNELCYFLLMNFSSRTLIVKRSSFRAKVTMDCIQFKESLP